jgi:hypothetical protein
MTFALQSREQREYNTDPQRRCYNGCHARSEWVWSDWSTLYSLKTEQEAQESVASWTALNKNCGRRLEYRFIEEKV